MLDHWDKYVSGVLVCLRESADYHPPRWNRYERRYSGANPHDLRTLKHFMEYCVKGWNATQKINRKTGQQKKIAYSTVRQRFTDFLAALQQRPKNKKVLHEVSTSMYHVRIISYPASLPSCSLLLAHANRQVPSHGVNGDPGTALFNGALFPNLYRAYVDERLVSVWPCRNPGERSWEIRLQHV